MRKILPLCVLFPLVFAQPALAQPLDSAAQPVVTTAAQPIAESAVTVQPVQPIETLAKEAIIVDANTGSVLLDKSAGDQMPTSSMSKLMTMYMVFEALKHGQLKLTDELLVSERAWKNSMDEGSRMYIQVGTKVKVEDLIRGVIVQSGNDASVALAEGVAGTEEAFADAMNVRAKEIGLTHSHFMNATGLPDPDHYSTPRDLAVLAYRIITDFPEYYPYFAEKEFTYNKIKQQNRDPLLGRVGGADGLKTGHTEIAGYGLVGSAKRDGRRVILVLNGLSSKKEREEEGIKLMEWAFRSFEAKKIVAKGEKVEDATVWLGHEPTVPMVAANDVNIVMPRAKRAELKLSVKYKQPLVAPVKAGDVIGTLVIQVPEQKPTEVQLLAGADDTRKGVFGRVKDRLDYLLTGSF